MPTGYTADVEDGTVTTLRQYALRCARAFGACISMRDDDMDLLPPKQLVPDTKYHDEHITEAQATLDRVMAMTEQECSDAAVAEFEAETLRYQKREEEKITVRKRYAAMETFVRDWHVPQDIAELKSFMLQQLSVSQSGGDWQYDKPRPMTGAEWLKKQTDAAHHDLKYHSKERLKTIERTTGANLWLKALYAALPEEN